LTTPNVPSHRGLPLIARSKTPHVSVLSLRSRRIFIYPAYKFLFLKRIFDTHQQKYALDCASVHG
jgi:hypothetical protein